MGKDEFMSMCANLTDEEIGWVRRLLTIMEQNNSEAMKIIDGFLSNCKAAQPGTIPRARFVEVLNEAEEAAKGV